MRANRSALSAITAMLVLAGTTGYVSAQADDTGGLNPITLPSGSVIHTTSSPVLNFRTVVVPNSPNVVALWDEMAGGKLTHFYAVSLDGQGLAGRVREVDYTIDLRYAKFDPLAGGEPVVNPGLRADAANELYIVQFHTVPLQSYRDNLAAAGAKVYDYLGNGAQIVRMDKASAQAVAAMPFVRWVGGLHPAYRVDDNAMSALLASAPDSTERWSITVFEKGLDQQNFVKGLVEVLGGVVHYTQDEMYRMEATMSPAVLAEVIKMNEVKFVDLWGGPGGLDMDIGRQVLGTNYVQTSPLNFDGTGVRGEIFDTETPATNPEWNTATGGNGVIYHQAGSVGGIHGSSCFGICFARGVSAQHKGHMPNGQGIFYQYASSTQFGGTKTRLAIAQESVDPNGPYRSVFQTSSVGSSQVTTYTSISAEMDDVLFQTGYLHCQSQSNLGTQSSRPQAWAKNMVSGGAVQHNNSSNPATYGVSGASIGPAQDGRVKPDLAGFYDNIATTSNTGYTSSFGGTSGGTPMVCGTIGIFFQMWHEGVWGGYGGGPSVFDSRAKLTTAKAAMIATARRFPFTQNGLNRYRQGWGMPDLQKLYDTRNSTFIIDADDPVNNLETKTYMVDVASGTGELLVTMAYLEPQGPLVNTQNRVNDLSLRVTDPSGTVYWGNNNLKTGGNFSTSGGASDTKDTVENVFLQSPAAGTWKIEVLGDEVVFDTVPGTAGVNAQFSLWVAGAEGAGGPPMAGNPFECNQADMIPFGNTFSSATLTRGYWFEAPVDFTICTVEVPNEAAQNVQNVEIVRFNNAAPPAFPGTTNDFVSLFKSIGAPVGVINTQIRVRRGDIIGVLGACGTTTMANSYGTPSGAYTTSLLGCPVTYSRMGMQFNLNTTGAAQSLWTEPAGQVSRVLLGVRAGPLAACPSELPDFNSTFSSATLTRGYYFTAPKDMTITGFRVPNEANQAVQNVEVVKLDAAPPAFPTTTNGFTSLGRFVNVNNNNVINTYINVKQGDIIGILGARGTGTMYNSYSASATNHPATIGGESVTVNRMGMQFNLNSNVAQSLFTEQPGQIARVQVYTGTTAAGEAILIDGDTTNTGLQLGSGPWNSPKGVVTFSGEFRLADSDPEFLAVGAFGNGFDIAGSAPGNSPAEIVFDADVQSVTFIYGGNAGSIQVDALNAANAVVDTFFQADTNTAQPAGPQTLAGPGIRKIRWNDTSGSYSILDNIAVKCVDSCYADCDLNGTLDFFDFLCFQNAFAAGQKYADCDGSGTLDFFDFLCFQNAFAAGCP